MSTIASRIRQLKQSGIRSASARCMELGGVNLGQGICALPVPQEIVEGAHRALNLPTNRYGSAEGLSTLRWALSEKIRSFNRMDVRPEQVLVTHGATGAFVTACMTLFHPGDEVILFEPFYGYHQQILSLFGIQIKTVPLDPVGLQYDEEALKQAIGPQTKGIVICTPNNPTGKVFSHLELTTINALAKANDLWILSDEIYEYITYPGFEHVSIASLPNASERVITISGFSKTFHMTGWRLGYASGPVPIIERMALIQDLLYICPAVPLQHAVVDALTLPTSYYQELRDGYLRKRDLVVHWLLRMGFDVANPQGAYYLLANIRSLGFSDDAEATRCLLEDAKVATVTGRSFFMKASDGASWLRLCFALELPDLIQAMQNIENYLEHQNSAPEPLMFQDAVTI